MGYPPRIEIPDGYYHVVTRGNDRRTIFEDERDRELFMLILRRVARRHGWLFYAYCLMGNHYHLVLQVGESGISRGMCELNTSYAVTSNARHRRTNHLFGRRFWSELITDDGHLLRACRYVIQNPVRAGLCDRCEEWPWSSFRATIGIAVPPPFLAVADVLAFAAPGAKDPIARFARILRNHCVPKRTRTLKPCLVAATVTEVSRSAPEGGQVQRVSVSARRASAHTRARHTPKPARSRREPTPAHGPAHGCSPTGRPRGAAARRGRTRTPRR